MDTRDVEAKMKAKEEEDSKQEIKRGDIPKASQAYEEYSCVSYFSEDTGIHEKWRRPAKDMLDYFATSRRTDFDAKKYLREQREKATVLFEA